MDRSQSLKLHKNLGKGLAYGVVGTAIVLLLGLFSLGIFLISLLVNSLAG